ncbi:response regulator [Candidatus Parcubacteria bacterium]|jgi:CheY-like chemotaxis protein|nr:MAG: response regulator [Candidatus Parcubacteria bacterium]
MSKQSQPKVLIIDDEPLLQESEAEFAKLCGYDTVCATSADEAIHLFLIQGPFKFIVCDFDLHGLSGVDLAVRIQNMANNKCPRIIMTSGSLQLLHDAIERSGLRVFKTFGKPYDAQEFMAALEPY